MKKNKKMTDDKLRAITDKEIRQSLGYDSSTLTNDRQKALEYYYAKPINDLAPSIIDGRSSAVSTDVLDTIEWMLPSLLKIFVGSDTIVEFEAKNPQSEQIAKQATEYIGTHIFKVENEGFEILYAWFKDALLQKNGIVKVWWDEQEEEIREDYTGLSDMEFAMLLQDTDVEPIEHTARMDETGAMVHDIAVKQSKKMGKVCIENVPPDEFLISRRAKNIKDAPFCAHRFERTISELTEAGYKNVDMIFSDENGDYGNERTTRWEQNTDGAYSSINSDTENGDPTSRVVWVTECYMKVDYDGDGIQEWRKIVRGGSQILENQECDGPPFESITPIPISHQFFGLSEADLAMESQRTKTSLLRALIDNIYLSVNGRTWAMEGQVNLDDLLTSRPGGIVRVKSPTAVGPLPSGSGDMGGAMQMMDYFDQLKENRTGFTRYSQGGNADALNQTATGMNIITNRSDVRLELVARCFAQGVKRLFIKILELVSKYQDEPAQFKAGQEWVEVNPREWKNQFNLNVNVGLGTGNKDQILQHLQLLGQAMQQAAPSGVVTPENVYNAGIKLCETLGFNSPEKFFTDPAKNPKPPQPNPEMEMMKVQVEIEKQKMELEKMKAQQKMLLEKAKLDAEIHMDHEELAAKIGIQQATFNHKALQAMQNDRLKATTGNGINPAGAGPGNPGQSPVQ